jgi:DNA-binding response OmpR family regulator
VPKRLNRKPILIVDDDAEFTAYLSRLLSSSGYRPTVVSTEAAARASVIGAPPVVILIDVCLGKTSGWAVARALLAVAKVPVIMMTGGDVDADVRNDAKLLGTNGILQKPFETAELLRVLGEVT